MVTSVLVTNITRNPASAQKIIGTNFVLHPNESIDLIGFYTPNQISELPAMADAIVSKIFSVSIKDSSGTISNVGNAYDFKALLIQSSAIPASDLTSAIRAGAAPIPIHSTSLAVTFTSTLSNTNYVVHPSFLNDTDVNPMFQNINITEMDTNGFTASWTAPTDSPNYLLQYTAIPFA